MIQGQALTFAREVATTRELQPFWEQAPILSTLSSYTRDEIPVLQFFSPSSMNLKTEKSPVTINKLISRSLCIHFYTLSIHGSPVLPPLNSSQSLILLYLQCLFSGVSMYPTATDFYLTLFPLHTHTHKKKNRVICCQHILPSTISISSVCLNYKLSIPGTSICEESSVSI